MYSQEQKQWLVSNYDRYTEKDLALEFNKIFGTDKKPTGLNSYIRNCLGVSKENPRGYTDEEIEFLKVTYPKYGPVQTTKMFQEKFNRNKSLSAIKKYCCRTLGLKCTDERLASRYKDMESPIGKITRNCRGVWKIKTENGWIPLTHLNRNVPKGHMVIHLDKNKDNHNDDNLLVIKNGIQRIVMNANMWSDDTDIARTSFKWAELYKHLRDNGTIKRREK